MAMLAAMPRASPAARLDGMALAELTPIFTVQPSKRPPMHYGGRMMFLPDGTLLLTTGDGFVHREEAQRLDNLLGKVVRLNDDGSIPADNPFVGAEPGATRYGPTATAIPKAWRWRRALLATGRQLSTCTNTARAAATSSTASNPGATTAGRSPPSASTTMAR